jgi:hypothetical protein
MWINSGVPELIQILHTAVETAYAVYCQNIVEFEK